MLKQIVTGAGVCALCLALTACQPSDEKIAQAKEKYVQLVEAHNQVVEAHGKVADDSLDEELNALREKADEMGSCNLAEMKDEEIDELVQTMDSMIEEYEGYLAALSDIKSEEEAAVLTSITLALTNETGFSFSELGTLAPEQSLTGLIIQRDAENTPWILVLADENGKKFELELPVKEYSREGVSLSLSYDEEADEILIS